MESTELAERLTRLEEQMLQTRKMFLDHIESEERQFAEIASHVKELRDILVGAKGAIRVLGWIIVTIGSIGAMFAWLNHNLIVNIK